MMAAEPMPSFVEIYDAHIDYLWRAALRMGLDQASAEDVVQQTFVVAFRRLDDFEGRASLRTWLFRILLHQVRQHRRSLRRKSPHAFGDAIDPDELSTSGDTPDMALARSQASRLVQHFLQELSEEKAEVFALMEIEHMTGPEVAVLLEVPVQTVYSRQRAARAQFEIFVGRIHGRGK